MKEVAVTDLPVDAALKTYLCHNNGEILHRPGELFTRSHRALLYQCEIETVILTDSDEETETLKVASQNQTVKLEDIPVNEPVPVTLFKKGTQPVVEAGDLFTKTLLEQLNAEQVESLSFRKDDIELNTFQCSNYRSLLQSDKFESLGSLTDPDEIVFKKESEEPAAAETALPEESIPEERFLHKPSKQITHASCKQLMGQPEMLCVPAGNPDYKAPVKVFSTRESEVKGGFNNHYMEWLAMLDEVFNKLKSNREVAFDSIDSIAKNIVENYFLDCLYCLNLMNARHPPISEKYLLMHSVNVALAATGVGLFLGYPLVLVRELAIGALLHDIGHLLTFRPLLAKKELDSTEQQKYDQHSVVGMAMLKNITKVPISTMLVVGQHHEFCNGGGRIYHAKKTQLHDFARIVGVVDRFETSCRFYSSSASVALAVRGAQNGELDILFIKALLSVLSLYPVGSAILLSNGLIGKVVNVYPDAFKTPVVRTVFKMSDGHLFPIDTFDLIDLKKDTHVRVVREIGHSALKSDIAIGF